jgi:hypothetical protein
MRWLGLGADVLMACCGAVILLHAYRVLGKPAGADAAYDAAMSRQSWLYKAAGWCIVAMATLVLIDYVMRIFVYGGP